MRVAKICLCTVQCLLLLLILVPLACALEQERTLPDSATQVVSQGATPAFSPAPAPGPTIEDVWLQNGGARLYYSALYGARQQYMGGASRLDPACTPLLPALRAWGAPEPRKKAPARSSRVVAANPCPEVDKAGIAGASAPSKAAASTSKAPAGAAEKAAQKASAVKKAAASSKAAAKTAPAKVPAAPAKAAAAAGTDKKTSEAANTRPLNTTPKPDLPAGAQPQAAQAAP